MSKPNNNLLLYLLLFFVAASFFSLTRNPLLNDDAALYALSAKNTILYHQWLAPLVTPGDPSSFLDKPPLGIWLLAVPMKIFGISELSIHFSNLIYYALLLASLYCFLIRLGKNKIALLAAAVASTSLALVVYSRTPKLDILLAFFVMLTHLFIFAWLKKDRPFYLYLAALAAAGGFLVKSGFALVFPGLTVIWLLIFFPAVRRKIFSIHLMPAFFIFLLPVGLILGLQYGALGNYWVPYLKSITVQGKYNASYLGLGLNLSVLGILLITIFPWTPFIPLTFKIKGRAFTLGRFANAWFLSNFLFVLFFFKLADFRTFTVFVPPLAILASLRLRSLQTNPRGKKWGTLLGNTLFFIIFLAAALYLRANPYNAQGIDLSSVRQPILLFMSAIVALYYFLMRPSKARFIVVFFIVSLAYTSLFYFALPLARAFNPESAWPKIIQDKKAAGYQFFIYRPPTRNLTMSPDLFYPDFMAGPADQYFTQQAPLLSAMKGKVILLSDSASLKQLRLKKNYRRLVQDDYAEIIEIVR